MASGRKVALITGGASGMGLAVATSLAARGGWDLHLVDLNPSAGAAAAQSLPSATFHQADITDYDSLAKAFKNSFTKARRLDFVFANAGIAEKKNFYQKHETGNDGLDPPPKPDALMTRIMFDGVISTSHLALHYFRLSPKEIDKSIVITSSCGGIYPSNYSPTYTAIKTGNVGWMRAIAKPYYYFDGVRVNAICPGTVKTNLLSNEQWQQFPEEFFTPVETIQRAVLMLVDGKDTEPASKTRIDGVDDEKKGVFWGEAVECCGPNHYFREANKYCDQAMEAVMKATDIVTLNPGDVKVLDG